MKAFRGKRIAVIYGGWSAERNISLKSGAAVRQSLRRQRIPHAGIDLSPRIAEDLRRLRINLAFLACHGSFGEDGRLQGLLDVMGISYTGSGVLASALAMHKPSSKIIFDRAGLASPRWAVLPRPILRERRSVAAEPRLALPVVVKPASQGSAVGVQVVRRRSEMDAALRSVWKLDAEALIEAYTPGTEITVGILGERVLPVVEIVPAHGFYDYHSKYAPGGSRHIVPARLPQAVLARAQAMALAAHRALGCRHVSRVDLMVRGSKPFLLEVNTLPGLTSTSLLPDAARAVGMDFDGLVRKLLELAAGDL